MNEQTKDRLKEEAKEYDDFFKFSESVWKDYMNNEWMCEYYTETDRQREYGFAELTDRTVNEIESVLEEIYEEAHAEME